MRWGAVGGGCSWGQLAVGCNWGGYSWVQLAPGCEWAHRLVAAATAAALAECCGGLGGSGRQCVWLALSWVCWMGLWWRWER